MQPSNGDVLSAIHYRFYGLPAYSEASSQFGVTHVFFIITRRRFSCDS